jgi:hypothetical protein
LPGVPSRGVPAPIPQAVGMTDQERIAELEEALRSAWADNNRLIAQVDEDRWDDWGATPCEVCGAGCLYGSRHTRCGDLVRRAEAADRYEAALETIVAVDPDEVWPHDMQDMARTALAAPGAGGRATEEQG